LFLRNGAVKKLMLLAERDGMGCHLDEAGVDRVK